MFPAVNGYGDFEVETFDEYYSRWPESLSHIPRGVVEDWIYRHWRDFSAHWIKLSPQNWKYKLSEFSEIEIMEIDHVGTWIKELDSEGVEYVTGKPRSKTKLAQYMLSNGTFPRPIIVAKSAGHIMHPRSNNEAMKEPYQLIEGHCRLACIRGMINSNNRKLAASHEVYEVEIPKA
jgi:hypothetical protein